MKNSKLRSKFAKKMNAFDSWFQSVDSQMLSSLVFAIVAVAAANTRPINKTDYGPEREIVREKEREDNTRSIHTFSFKETVLLNKRSPKFCPI